MASLKSALFAVLICLPSFAIIAFWHIAIATVDVEGTSRHVCVLDEGEVKCWGDNSSGQLGAGVDVEWSDAPLQVVGLSGVIAVSPRDNHTCAVKLDRTAWCWGGNRYGQLGNGTLGGSNVPVQVVGIDNATGIAAGVFHSCALLTDGTIKCWGYNAYGQLGDGTRKNSSVPVAVNGLSDASTISTGGDHNCTITSSRDLYCWGWNVQGQVGGGNFDENTARPTLVEGIKDPVQVTNGDYHTCALVAGGRVWCWGLNGKTAPLGGVMIKRKGTTARVSWTSSGGDATYEIAVSDGRFFVDIKGQSYEANGLDPAEEYVFTVVAIYSGQTDGQLGNGSFINSNVPTAVIGVDDAVQIDSGYATTCARLADGAVKCWGRNNYGQIGPDAPYPSTPTPYFVKDVYGASDIAVAASSCVVHHKRSVKCWGWRLPSQQIF